MRVKIILSLSNKKENFIFIRPNTVLKKETEIQISVGQTFESRLHTKNVQR